MDRIVYKVVGSRGQWFIEHSGGRYGPFKTKAEAMKIAKAARSEGRDFGLQVAVTVRSVGVSFARNQGGAARVR